MDICSNNILLVEDDTIISDQIRYYLENLGHQVFSVYEKFEEALNVINTERRHVDLAILDINLGRDLNGIEFGTYLMDKYNIPILFITGETSDLVLDKALDLKPIALLQKPFTKSQLKDSINYLESYSNTESNSSSNLIVECGNSLKALNIENVHFIHKLNDEIVLHKEREKETCEFDLFTMQDQFLKKGFIRCHRDFLVNTKYIKQYDKRMIEVLNTTIPSSTQAYQLLRSKG